MTDLTLGLRIRVNDDGSVQVLNQTGAGLDRVSNSASRANQHVNSLARTVTAAAASLAAGFSMSKIIDEIGSFESKMINVKALTVANVADMKAMETQARELGATTAFSAQQAAEAQGVLASAGLKTNEILSATPQVLNLASAGSLDLARAAEIATGTMKGMGLALTDLPHINDVLAKTAAETSTNVGEIGAAMQNIAPLAQAFGISIEDISASIGILANNQIKGSEAGNNMKSMLVALGQETKEKTELLAQHGLAYADLNVQVKGYLPVLETLKKANLSGAEALTLFGADAAAASLILTRSVSEVDKLTEALKKSKGAADAAAAILNSGLKKELDALLGTVSEGILQLGDAGLKGALSSIITTATGVISIYEGMGGKFSESNNLTKEQYGHLKNVADELKTVAGAASGIAVLTGAIWAADVAMAAFNATTRLNPLLAIAGLAAAGIGAVISKIDTAKQAHEDFMKSATSLEEANLKVKQQIANVNKLVPVGTPGYSQKILQEQHDTAMAELKVLVDQRNALEEKANAVNTATEADKKSTAVTVAHTTHQAASAEATKKAAGEAKKAADAEKSRQDSVIATLNALQSEIEVNRLAENERARETERRSAIAKAIGDEIPLIEGLVKTKYAELEVQKLLDAGIMAGKSAMDAELDRYDKLTMSAEEYLYTQLLLKGVSPGTAVETVSFASVNDGLEAQKKAIEAARDRMADYDKIIKQVNESTAQLSATNSAVFDGALGGINTVVGALQNMTNSLKSTVKQQELLNTAYANEKSDINKLKLDDRQKYTLMLGVEADYLKANKKLDNDKTNESLSGMRQVIGATAQMFDQKSSRAKALHNLEMGIAVAQMAMQGVQMVKDVAATAVSMAAGAAKFFAQSGWAGFAGVAAMGVVMAGLGYAAFSGDGAGSPGPQGLSPDTGTVLGDSSAKSQSIDKTYQLLKDIQAQNYPVLKSIDKGISDLHYGITDVITRLYQAGGLTPVNAPATTMTGILPVLNSIDPGHILRDIDPIGAAIMGALFGGKQSSTVVSQGIAIDPTTLNDIINKKNLNARQFAQIETKTDGGWFGSDSFSFSNQYSELDSKTQKALNSVFKSMGDTMLGLADNLGLGLSDRVKDYVIPSLMINLQGLNGEDAAKKLSGILSTTLDTMSDDIFGKITGDYQKLGEGMLETTTRVVTQVAIVNDALSSIGSKLSGDMVSQLKVADDTVYKFGGGWQVFQKNFESGFDKFASPEAKQDRLLGQIKSQFDGIFTADQISTLTKSREEYGKLFAALDQTNPLYAQQVASMVNLAEKSDNYYKGVEESASKTRALQISLLDAQGHAEEALFMTRQDALKGMSDYDAGIQAEIYALEDAAKLRKLEIDLLTAQGNAGEALVRTRQEQLRSLTNEEQVIQKAIYHEQDLAKTRSMTAELLTAESKVRGDESKALQVTKLSREQELKATDALLVALKQQIYITNDLAAATDKLYATMKKSVELNVQLQNELGNTYAAEQLSRTQTLADMTTELNNSKAIVADAVSNLTTATDKLSSVTQTLGISQAATGNYANFTDAQIKQYINDNGLKTVDELIAAANKYNVNPLQVGSLYGLDAGATAKEVQNASTQLNPAPYNTFSADEIRQYVADNGLTTVAQVFEAAKSFNLDPYAVGAAYGFDKEKTTGALKEAGINLVDIPGFTDLLANQKDLTTHVGLLTNVADRGTKDIATQQSNIDTQSAIYAAKDAKIKQGLDIELMSAQGRAYDALAASRQNELKALSPANQELKKQIYTLQDAAKSRGFEIELLNAQGLSYQALLKTREDDIKGLSDSDAAIKRSTYAAQDAAKTRGFEIELLNAQGLSYQALLKTREDDIKGLSDSDAAIKRSTYAAQDAAKTRGLEIELLNLSGDSVKALAMTREDELQGLSSTDQALKKHIYTLQDFAMALDKAKTTTGTALSVLQKSVEAERKTITDTYNAGVKNTQDAIDQLTKSTDKLKGLSSSLKGYLDKLAVPGNEAFDRSFAQAQIAGAIQLAKTAGVGAITNQDALVKAIDVLGRPSDNLFGSAVDFERDIYKTAISVAELSALTDVGLNVDEKQLKALQTSLDNDKKLYEGEMTRLDDVVAHAAAQIDAINGTTIAVMSVRDAIANLGTAVAVQQAVQASQQIAASDAALSAGATSGSYTTTEMYDPTTGITTVTSGGWSADRIPGFATGGQHDGGWRIVGENGPELEYTGPSRIFSNPQSQSLLDNGDLVAEIKELRAVIARQAEVLNQIKQSTANTATNTQKTADVLDNNTAGGGPMLVKAVS